MKVVWKWVALGILFVVILFILGTLLEIGGLATLKWRLGLKRQAIKSSLQYNESKVSLLWQLYEEYLVAGEAHKAALVKRMRVEAHRIPESDVPQEIWRVIK